MNKAPIDMENPPMGGNGARRPREGLLRLTAFWRSPTLAGNFFATIGDGLFP